MLNVYTQGDLERDLREIFETEQIVTIYDSPDDTDIYYADNKTSVPMKTKIYVSVPRLAKALYSKIPHVSLFVEPVTDTGGGGGEAENWQKAIIHTNQKAREDRLNFLLNLRDAYRKEMAIYDEDHLDIQEDLTEAERRYLARLNGDIAAIDAELNMMRID